MTQTPNPPAGWYPQGNQERWWDGTAWSDNFRPLGSEQTQQPYAQPQYAPPTYGQPTYGQPVYGQPQPYVAAPVQKSHTARNILIVFAVIFLVGVGGCLAAGIVFTKKINDVVNDDSLGGPNNPMTITEGKAFSVRDFDYADGWKITEEPVSQTWQIEGLKVIHRMEASMRPMYYTEMPEERLQRYRSMATEMVHPLVWTQGDGRKSLVLGTHADEVVGQPLAAGRSLIARLMEWAGQPAYSYSHEWQEGDFVIWNNCGVMHRVVPYDEESGRSMHRTTIMGEQRLGRPLADVQPA